MPATHLDFLVLGVHAFPLLVGYAMGVGIAEFKGISVPDRMARSCLLWRRRRFPIEKTVLGKADELVLYPPRSNISQTILSVCSRNVWLP